MIWILIGAIGFLAVLQGGMNRVMAQSWGLPGTLLLNAIVFLSAAAVFYFSMFSTWMPQSASISHIQPFEKLKIWHILPGLFGFLFVLGVPLAISRVGAALTFLGLVVAQVAAGAARDIGVEHKGIGLQRVAGICIALVGVWLATRERV